MRLKSSYSGSHAAGQFFVPATYQEGFDDEDECAFETVYLKSHYFDIRMLLKCHSFCERNILKCQFLYAMILLKSHFRR